MSDRLAAPPPSSIDLRAILDRTAEGMVVLDRAWRYAYVNARAAELLDRPAEALAGQHIWTVWPAAVGGPFQAACERAVATRELVTLEVQRSDGGPWLESRLHPSEEGLLILFQDATERHRRAAAAEARAQTFWGLAEHAPDVIARFDLALRHVYVNPAAETATGIPPSGFLGRSHEELVPLGMPAVLAARWTAALARARDTNMPVELSFSYPTPAGERWFDVRIAPERDVGGRVVSVMAVGRDVTRERAAERALREAESTFRSLVEQSLSGIYIIRDGRFDYVNPRFAEIFGCTVDEVLALRSVTALVHPDDRALVAEQVRRRHAGEARAAHYTFRGVRRDGRPVLVEVDGLGADVQGGRAIVGTLVDVTDRRASSEALRLSEERFRLVAAASHSMIYDHDFQTGTLYRSEALFTSFGYRPEQVSADGEWWMAQVHPEDRERFAAMRRDALAGTSPTWTLQYRLRRGDDGWATVLERGMLIRDAAGEPWRVIGTVLDVTERDRLEERLRQALKMEAVGRLAGGIAHDFNNVLTAILASAELALASPVLPRGTPLESDLQEIRKSAVRAAGLTRQLLAFSRQQVLHLEIVGLNDVIADTESLLHRVLGDTVSVRLRLGAETGAVRADRHQLEQVLVNLAVNARDAMPAGGTLTIATEAVTLPAGGAPGRPELPAGEYAVLVVRDTGIGMDELTRARIFEPFFTTKEVGQGTGLGLAVVYGIVSQSGGTVAVSSAPGAGSSFAVYLPRVAPDAPTWTPAPAARPAPTGGVETVLVIEREEAVRRAVARTLVSAGYSVIEAAHAGEAVARWEARRPEVHLLVVDAAAPEIGGVALVRRLRAAGARTPALFLSARADEPPAGTEDLEGVRSVGKPFAAAVLLEAVRAALDGGTPPRGRAAAGID